jgi:hypothetical protein
MSKNLLVEKYIPAIRLEGGYNSKLPITLNGSSATLTVGGTSTFTGVATFTAAPVFSAVPSGLGSPVVQSALVGATVALTTAQSGGTFQNRSTSGSPSWTLPTCANGLEYTFTCANTTTGFTVTGAQVIHAKTSATGTAITTTTTLTNTQATAVVGDAITIVGDGTAWWVTAQTGIFAAS